MAALVRALASNNQYRAGYLVGELAVMLGEEAVLHIIGSGIAKAATKAAQGVRTVAATRTAQGVTATSSAAAKVPDDLTRVGRWMSEAELLAMQKTGRVQEGGGGRTFVTNPANPAAFPAGKGVFAEFDVPTDSLFPAGKSEWSVIPGPNVTSRRFGTPPSQMPPALCIVVTCRVTCRR